MFSFKGLSSFHFIFLSLLILLQNSSTVFSQLGCDYGSMYGGGMSGYGQAGQILYFLKISPIIPIIVMEMPDTVLVIMDTGVAMVLQAVMEEVTAQGVMAKLLCRLSI
uniref:Uncharacterized protein n=1 Tax=Meloidogyne incognita TaxID=6306 RepID=A0A914LZN5_MELIC